MPGYAEAWAKYLPGNHRRALYHALCELSDDFFDFPLDSEENELRQLLPGKYFHRYNPLFLKRFYASLLTVGYKLALPRQSSKLIACTAEELALRIIIDRAGAILDADGVEADFGAFLDEVFQDVDFEYLYEPERDGIEDSETGEMLGIVNLRFSEWFKPFPNAIMPVHPYCLEDVFDSDADGSPDGEEG